jgi:hypothetical protein
MRGLRLVTNTNCLISNLYKVLHLEQINVLFVQYHQRLFYVLLNYILASIDIFEKFCLVVKEFDPNTSCIAGWLCYPNILTSEESAKL